MGTQLSNLKDISQHFVGPTVSGTKLQNLSSRRIREVSEMH